jgi:hypothetical protein
VLGSSGAGAGADAGADADAMGGGTADTGVTELVVGAGDVV